MKTRLKRSQEGRALHITERDMQIFRVLYESTVASADQLAALLGEYPLTQGLERRLYALYKTGFLTRPATNYHLYGPTHTPYGMRRLVYSLGSQGVQSLLLSQDGLDHQRLDFLLATPPTLISHALMVSQVRAVLHRATVLDPHHSLDNWTQGHSIAVQFHTNNAGKLVDKSDAVRNHGVKPDAFAAVGVFAKGRHQTQHFFIEADRSTMDHERMLAKYRNYWLLWRHNQHQEQLGLESFVVLTVTVSPKRRDNLAQLARKADDAGRGSLMFRFATEKDFDLERPEQILSPVWRTPVEKRPLATMLK